MFESESKLLKKHSSIRNTIKKRKHDSQENVEEIDKKRPKRNHCKNENHQPTNSQAKLLKKDVDFVWNDYELLAEKNNLSKSIANNLVNLFTEECTIPFIARYRRHLCGDMSPEELRDAKKSFDEINLLKSKISNVLKTVEKLNKLDTNLRQSIVSVRSVEELEHVYAPFKVGSKRTLAEKAKQVGLEPPALDFLYNNKKVDLQNYVQPDIKELKNIAEVEKGVIHIIAGIIATDTELLQFIRELRSKITFMIETKKSTSKNIKEDSSKYEIYFNFQKPVKYLKPHQILAINRGESHKILSVKIVIPDLVFDKLVIFCRKKWNHNNDSQRNHIMNEAIKDSYNRLIQPLMIREIRGKLKEDAEKASYDVFSTNLKHLLLTSPIKGKPILAIDPGYSNGCKLALISSVGSLLAHNIIFPLKSSNKHAETVLKNILLENSCSLIALGNGTACRKIEEWLDNLIKRNVFHPLDVTYTIINEDGASIYSCSPEAKKEFPNLDVNIISAISLARRLQDPLAELVKVEPKHLGVGMYQHDLKPKQLDQVLDETVSECVSFVGVDLNTTSQSLLRRVSGLSDKRAQQIIEYRSNIGYFTNRKQLMDVKGIGPQIFKQCAGFLRVGPINTDEIDTFFNKFNTTKLDGTYIHPESYDLTAKLLNKFKLLTSDVGNDDFINNIKIRTNSINMDSLAADLKTSKETIKLILDALSKPIGYDLRHECSKVPLFKKNLTSIYDIQIGETLTGRINNVTHFGCFVDIGVESNGLIHSSKLNGLNLQIGERVEVVVVDVDIKKKRIGLKAVKKL